ncbi:hypothetical protein ALC57_09313, partial [Trachymyrmex cornetzi]
VVKFIVGNMFWKVEAISFSCMPSPLKLFKINRGELLKASSYTSCFFNIDITSRVKEKLCILKVSAGPLGNL